MIDKPSSLLVSKDEVLSSVEELEILGLDTHHDLNKCWDCLKSYKSIISENKSKKNIRILDAGSGAKPVILRWLNKTSNFELYACDYEAKGSAYMIENNINFNQCDISQTPYSDCYFDSIYSISVIEHGVDIHDFFTEMHRILIPNGTLHISTDYWPIKMDTKSKFPYGEDRPPMNVFSRDELKALISIANQIGFDLPNIGNIFDNIDKPVVRWDRMDEGYTFVYLRFTKK